MRLVLLMLVLGVLCFPLASCTLLGCKEVVEAQVPAPDGILVATWTTRDCGATTDYGTSVNLHRSDHGFDDVARNLFVAKGRRHLNVKWIDADNLSIECNSCERRHVSRIVTILGKTNITYETPLVAPPSRGEPALPSKRNGAGKKTGAAGSQP